MQRRKQEGRGDKRGTGGAWEERTRWLCFLCRAIAARAQWWPLHQPASPLGIGPLWQTAHRQCGPCTDIAGSLDCRVSSQASLVWLRTLLELVPGHSYPGSLGIVGVDEWAEAHPVNTQKGTLHADIFILTWELLEETLCLSSPLLLGIINWHKGSHSFPLSCLIIGSPRAYRSLLFIQLWLLVLHEPSIKESLTREKYPSRTFSKILLICYSLMFFAFVFASDICLTRCVLGVEVQNKETKITSGPFSSGQ